MTTSMRFNGQQAQIVDAKNRLVIPAKFRPGFTDKVLVGPVPQDKFFVLSVSSEEVHAERMKDLEERAKTNPDLENTIRLIDAETELLDLDDQARITLTGNLRGIAGLERDVVVIGRGRCLEIWTQGRWEDFRKQAFENAKGLKDSLFRV